MVCIYVFNFIGLFIYMYKEKNFYAKGFIFWNLFYFFIFFLDGLVVNNNNNLNIDFIFKNLNSIF